MILRFFLTTKNRKFFSFFTFFVIIVVVVVGKDVFTVLHQIINSIIIRTCQLTENIKEHINQAFKLFFMAVRYMRGGRFIFQTKSTE